MYSTQSSTGLTARKICMTLRLVSICWGAAKNEIYILVSKYYCAKSMHAFRSQWAAVKAYHYDIQINLEEVISTTHMNDEWRIEK